MSTEKTNPSQPKDSEPGAPHAGSLPSADPNLNADLMSEFGTPSAGNDARDPDEIYPGEDPGAGEGAGELFNAEILAELLEMGTEYLAARNGDHWHLSPAERKNAANISKRFFDHHASAFAAHQVDLSMGVMVLTVFGPRLLIDAKRSREAEAPGAAQ